MPPIAAWGANFTECWANVCHGSDLPLWFHPLEQQLGANYTADEDALSASMETYWANFARTGNPNTPSTTTRRGEALPAWPAYSAATRSTLDFKTAGDGGIAVLSDVRKTTCDWWDARVGYHVY